MSRVLYLQDLNFTVQQGGAEMTDRGYFWEGVRRGHKMDIITPENAPVTPAEKDDLVIISNCRRFDRDALLKIPCRTVIFSHDTYCLTPDQMVYVDYVPAPISEVPAGKHILGEHGLDFVKATMCRPYQGEIVEIVPRGIPAIKCTPEHPILIIPSKTMQYAKDHNRYVQRSGSQLTKIEIGTAQAVFRNAGELQRGDFVVVPRVSEEQAHRISFGGWKQKFFMTPFDEEMAELLGWYVAEGSGSMANGIISFALSWDELHVAERLSEVLHKKFDLSATITQKTETHSTELRVQCRPFLRWLHENFGQNARTKFLPSWLIKAPKKELVIFLKNYVSGDGYFNKNKGRFTCATASKRLAHGLFLAFAKVGMLCSIITSQPKISFLNGKMYKTNEQYALSVDGKQADVLGMKPVTSVFKPKYIKTESAYLVPILKTRRSKYDGLVFNMETSSNVFAAPIVMHNCLYRLYLPNSQKCLTDCPAFDFWDKLYSNAALKIFLSPLHYEVHKLRFKESVEPHILAPSCIDTSLFRKKGRKRSGYCNVSGFMGYKGRAQLIEFAKANPDSMIDVVGSTEEPGMGQGAKDVPPNMKALGPMPYHELNEFFNRHEYYVDLPDTCAPFTRSLAEAYLSGCKIVSNELMGCMSYPWFKSRDSVRKHLNLAPKQLWDTLEKELKI